MQSSVRDICSPLLTEQQAAEYLTRSVSSLRRDRKRGTGPNFVRLGRSVRYLKSELDSYILGCAMNASGAEVDHGR
jgi:predicted DNA-binding transcriptional regulator AlpA